MGGRATKGGRWPRVAGELTGGDVAPTWASRCAASAPRSRGDRGGLGAAHTRYLGTVACFMRVQVSSSHSTYTCVASPSTTWGVGARGHPVGEASGRHVFWWGDGMEGRCGVQGRDGMLRVLWSLTGQHSIRQVKSASSPLTLSPLSQAVPLSAMRNAPVAADNSMLRALKHEQDAAAQAEQLHDPLYGGGGS